MAVLVSFDYNFLPAQCVSANQLWKINQ